MDDKERKRRFRAALDAEIAQGYLGLWWLSFADPKKPSGNTFLGVVILEAFGGADAIQRSHEMGLNPGGEVQAFRVDWEGHPVPLRNRILQRDELVDIGVSVVDHRPCGDITCSQCNGGS